jgi:hypothetical protein
MTDPIDPRRERIAELRAAVIRAHPDYDGTTESLQVALAALRAEQLRTCHTSPPAPQPAAQRRNRSSRSSSVAQQRTLQGVAIEGLKALAWAYGLVLPIMLALALLIARANAWLLGG